MADLIYFLLCYAYNPDIGSILILLKKRVMENMCNVFLYHKKKINEIQFNVIAIINLGPIFNFQIAEIDLFTYPYEQTSIKVSVSILSH